MKTDQDREKKVETSKKDNVRKKINPKPSRLRKWLIRAFSIATLTTIILPIISFVPDVRNMVISMLNPPTKLNKSQLISRIVSDGIFNQNEKFIFYVPDEAAICVWEFDGEEKVNYPGEKVSTDKAQFFANEERSLPWPTPTAASTLTSMQAVTPAPTMVLSIIASPTSTVTTTSPSLRPIPSTPSLTPNPTLSENGGQTINVQGDMVNSPIIDGDDAHIVYN